MVFKRIAAVLLWLLVTLTSAFGFASSELETASGDFFCGTLEDAGRNDSASRFLCRINGWLNYDTLSECAVAANKGVKALPGPRQVDANLGAFNNYRHGGQMSAIEHINYRHANNSGFSNVSRFSEGTSVRNMQSYINAATGQQGSTRLAALLGEIDRPAAEPPLVAPWLLMV
jgi:hypothetical protein